MYLFRNSTSCIYRSDYSLIAIKEFVMITIVKWIVTAVLAGLAWLVGNYTVEYFRPYKRN
jgi:hypothetical protein